MKKYLFIFFLIGIWSCEDAKESQTIKFLKVSEVMNDGGYDVIQSVNDEYFIVGRREGNIYDPNMGIYFWGIQSQFQFINSTKVGRHTPFDREVGICI